MSAVHPPVVEFGDKREHVPRQPADDEDDDDRREDLRRLLHPPRAGQHDEEAALFEPRPDAEVQDCCEDERHTELEGECEDAVELTSRVTRPVLHAVRAGDAKRRVRDDVEGCVQRDGDGHGDGQEDADREK